MKKGYVEACLEENDKGQGKEAVTYGSAANGMS